MLIRPGRRSNEESTAPPVDLMSKVLMQERTNSRYSSWFLPSYLAMAGTRRNAPLLSKGLEFGRHLRSSMQEDVEKAEGISAITSAGIPRMGKLTEEDDGCS